MTVWVGSLLACKELLSLGLDVSPLIFKQIPLLQDHAPGMSIGEGFEVQPENVVQIRSVVKLIVWNHYEIPALHYEW